MKVKTISLASFSVLLITVMVMSLPQIATGADIGSPGDTAYQYLENLKSHHWNEAYNLTSSRFQEDIPIEAFIRELESSGFADNLVDFSIGNIVVEDSKAEVEVVFKYLNPGEKLPVRASNSVTSIKEIEGWRIDLLFEDFLASKLDTQAPLAISQHKGVSVSIQYILSYPATELDPGHSRIRLDIRNESGNILRWELPVFGTSESYVKDLSTNEMYLPVGGYGAMGKKGEAFHLNFKEGPPFVLTAAPDTQGSIFIHLESIPESVKLFDMVLDGFSFPDVDESWNTTFDSVPFVFDVTPTD